MSENSQNLKPGARAVTGYFYAESYEYLNFATSAQRAHEYRRSNGCDQKNFKLS